MGREEQRYATISMLVVLGVIALLLVVKFSSVNLLGYAIDDPTTMSEGESQTIALSGGTTYDVSLLGVYIPDETGLPSALFSVDGEIRGRVYAGETIAYADTQIKLFEASQGMAVFRLETRTLPAPADPAELLERDTLFEGDKGLYTLSTKPEFMIELLSADFLQASFAIDGQDFTLVHGDSLETSGITFTLYDSGINHGGEEFMEFGLSLEEYACTLDTQNEACRGGSACCGGQCTELPTCTPTMLDGPVLRCGERQMYCCDGELTFESCGPVGTCGNGICEEGEYDRCPAVGDGPCTLGTCPTDCTGTVACVKDETCPTINCVRAPCPYNLCLEGYCVEVYPIDDGGNIA